MIPIELGVNINDTATSAYFVRVHSSYKAQHKMVVSKKKRSVLQLQLQKVREDADAHISAKDYKKALKNEKRFKNEVLNSRIVASNNHFSYLKGEVSVVKQKGSYWKKKLIKQDLIVSKRKYKKMQKMSFAEYRVFKKHVDYGHRLSWSNGYVLEQLSNTLEVKRAPIELLASTKAPPTSLLIDSVSKQNSPSTHSKTTVLQ